VLRERISPCMMWSTKQTSRNFDLTDSEGSRCSFHNRDAVADWTSVREAHAVYRIVPNTSRAVCSTHKTYPWIPVVYCES